MKKVISLLLAMVMLLGMSIVCTSAYTLPEGFAVSSEEGAAFDSIEGEVIGYVGDADNSGDVTIKDATAIQKHIAQLVTIDKNAQLLADVDFSSDITIKDATAIQKWIAKIAVDAPVYHLLYKGEAQEEYSIVGEWFIEEDLAEVINSTLPLYTDDPLLLEYVNISTFPVKTIFSFEENGTLTTYYDETTLQDSFVLVKKELEGDLANYLVAMIKAEYGFTMSVQQILGTLGYSSMSELVDEMFPMDIINELTAPQTGPYEIKDNNKIYTSDENGEIDYDYYVFFTLTEDTLTIISANGDFDSFILTKVK